MKPSENVKVLLKNLGREVHAELGGAAAGWLAPITRAVTEADLAPWKIFTFVGPLPDDLRHADQGRTAQLQAVVFVNVTFEISESDDHYLSVFDGRVAAVTAIQRVLRDAPASLLIRWDGEEEAEVGGVTLSQSRVLISWDQPA